MNVPRAFSLVRVILIRTVRGFVDARGWDLAASLAYTSLLSFVPLVAAVTLLISTLFGRSGGDLFDLIRRTLPGASPELVADVQKAVAQARTLSFVATLFFVATSLRTFVLVEGAANALWGSTISRKPLRLVGLGIVVVLLGPISFGVATSLVLQADVPFLSFGVTGFVLSAVVFTTLYKAVPTASVRWGPAAVAGVLSAAGFVGLKTAFTAGVDYLTDLSHIYGSISVIVIFVMAVGFVWNILLLGVSLAHAIQFRHELLYHDEPEVQARRSGPFDEAVRMLLLIARHPSGVPLAVLSDEIRRPEDDTRSRLKKLVSSSLIVAKDDDSYFLAHRPEEISLYAVARAVGEATPRPIPAGGDPTAKTLRYIYRRADREERAVLQGTSLRDLGPRE